MRQENGAPSNEEKKRKAQDKNPFLRSREDLLNDFPLTLAEEFSFLNEIEPRRVGSFCLETSNFVIMESGGYLKSVSNALVREFFDSLTPYAEVKGNKDANRYCGKNQ